MGKNILQYLFSGYLKLLKKTVAIEWREIQFVTGNQVFGFWHEPKKLAFYLSEQAQESFVGISVSYHGCFRLFWRWDHYAIPLPFSKVSAAVHDYGEVNKKQIPDLPTRAEVSECGILLKDA